MLDELPADLEISPQAVASYLGTSGWDLEVTDPARQVWSLREGGHVEAELFLPLDPTYADFKRRFDISLQKLRRFYDWDSFQLATKVLSARSDLLFIRADQIVRYDSIPIKQAEQLIVGASQMMTAAAWSTLEKRPSFSGHKPETVRNFIEDEVRMGHTQRGSFVLTILTRLGDEDLSNNPQEGHPGANTVASADHRTGQTEDSPTDSPQDAATATAWTPFPRRVMSTLATALKQTSTLVSGKSVPHALDESVDVGVNAMLCDSLQEMSQFAGLRALDLSFQWAPAVPQESTEVNQVVFEKDTLLNVRTLSDRLKARSEIRRITVYGRVTKLERPEGAEDPDEAIVTVRGDLERNYERVFRVTLSGESHRIAIRAYRERTPIVITGDVDLSKASLKFSGNITIAEA
ncbi:hypothetical protein [Amycolatopsis sp. NPDC050768]|uniref:hypothetical protein n=1 Tax=Amycolatopsis sp. NPDC050768 TaxID=3154839 RepID=UPI0033D41065